jgi:polyketide synthase 12/myxalamid-type polyketide synthase MxaB
LRAAGRDVVVVRRGGQFDPQHDGFVIPATDAGAYERLLDSIAGDEKMQISGIIHGWSLDTRLDDSADVPSLHAVEDAGIRSLLYVTQAAAAHDAAAGSRLVVITRGAQPVRAGESAAPAHATMWGFANTIRLELPDLDCLCIDLDSNAALDASAVAARALTRGGENQLALRDGAWLAARLTRQSTSAHRDALADERVALVNTTPGVLDGLRFVPIGAEPLGPNDVEIRVHVSALNFRDVLVAMAMYPGASAAVRLGGECAGEVVAIGANVGAFAVGQSVVAMGAGGLGSYVRVNAEHVALLPSRMSADDAVTVPSVFVTAWHALYDLADLKAGERVLVHAGAGGVGLAAIQLAKRVGAKVFATAGSPAKRALLASLGVDHVMDSRSTGYVDEIARLTNGRGIDVVLNSLTDAHLAASMSALAPKGRFVELGKRGIWSNAQVAAIHPSAKYFVVDLLAVGANQPEVVGDVLRRVWRALEAGEIRPLPHTDFRSSEVESAFRYMAQAKHVGKIVVTRPRTATPAAVRGDGVYLVTGGLGGLGLTVADWLVARGAGRVVLMGRREPSAEIRARMDGWNAERERVVFARGDVGLDTDVRRVVDEASAHGLQLRGVMHSAGVLHDAVIVGQAWSNFEETFASKVDGAWSLHRATRSLPLDFFVLFSSISSVLGSPGQGNHAAANAFMDALAHYRRASGLAALSINWGAWSDVGAANERGVGARIGAQGMGTISPEEGVHLLERVMTDDETQTAVMPVDWSKFSLHHGGGRLRSTLFAALAKPASPSTRAARSSAESKAPVVSEISIRDAAPAVRWDVLLDRMRSLTARVLGLDASAPIDVQRPLQELGLDSLMAVELRNSMKKELGLERPVAATIVFDHPTVAALVEYVGGTVFRWPARGAAQPSAGAPVESTNDSAGLEGFDLLDQLENMSAAEVEQLLAKRMTAGD